MTIFCSYCQTLCSPLVSSSDKNRNTTDVIFHYYRCTGCEIVFMDPIPSDLRPFYQGGYQAIPPDLSTLKKIAAVERYRLEPILRYKSGGKLLEIGPWIGIFSSNAKDAGFDVTAIDIDEACVEFLNTIVGIRAMQSSDPARALACMEEKFDVIVIWHCLEHLREPWLVIARAAEKLAPGGVLLVAIPNIESREFSIFKEDWAHLDAPRHLYFYPVDSLVELCRKNGLEKLEVATMDELSTALSKHTWYVWARSKIYMKYITRILALVAFHTARFKESKMENSGSGITALFRKPFEE